MRRAITTIITALTLASVAGLLTPILPATDFANHARPLLTIASLLAVVAFHRYMVAWAVAAFNVGLLLLPLLTQAASMPPRDVVAGRKLTLVTFNLAQTRRPLDDVARFIDGTNADVALFQEVTREHARSLQTALGDAYPYRFFCGDRPSCLHAVISKRPWTSIEHQSRTARRPEMTIVHFGPAGHRSLTIANIHMAWPFQPAHQPLHIDRLIDFAREAGSPVILAGDFNATPWSHHLTRLQGGTGLVRHATYLRSWPADGQFHLPAPLMLIDHVLSTPDIRTVSISTGPDLGSDHLPVVATLALPE